MFKQSEPSTLREDWLTRLAELMAPEMARRTGLRLPPYRVTCGFPSRGGELGRKKLVLGQCWSAEASTDQHSEIFINPVTDDVRTVAAILSHELLHALTPGSGHRGPFIKAAKAIGHTGPFTQIDGCMTDAFFVWAMPLIDQVGAYPHHKLQAMAPQGQAKKQSTRLLKAECGSCGYTVRVTRKWVDAQGAPICPCNMDPMICEGMEEEAEDLAA